MSVVRHDALVVGAGPAGSIAALVLARGGARVALVDKATFPRDKACGDLIGPRGVQVLRDLGVRVAGRRLGDMEVIGPTGRRVILPASAGLTYPGFGLAVPRRAFDDGLRQAAAEAGAQPLTGRVGSPRLGTEGELRGFCLEGGDTRGMQVEADVIIGADGALSRVGSAAGLVDERRVLWGFAVRGYTSRPAPPLPQILLWEPVRRGGYPGYGWRFPGRGDGANIGLGVGLRGDRRPGVRVSRDLDAFVSMLQPGAGGLERRLGGWLKMGMVGTVAARGRTLLVGDAAGLVNPLQGEGISQALASGRAAAESVLALGPSGAAGRYQAELAALYAPHASSTAPITAWMLRHPKVTAAVSRTLTAPGVGRLLAPGWSVYWNDLLDGAKPGKGRRLAALADSLAGLVTGRSDDHRAIWDSLANPPSGARLRTQ